MKKKILGFIIVLMVNIIVVAMAPALAKNFNLPEGVERIYRSGGTAVVDTPADFPFSSLEIMAFNLEAGTHGPGESFVIQMPWMGGWMPIAHFTTSPDSVAFLSALWSGLTASANTMFVSDSELNVVRHGNRITASLTVPKVITMRVGEVTIPAFTMELNKVGGSIHTENTISLAGWPGASGYTIYVDNMGFNAEGVFTCEAWDYFEEEMTDEVIVMHGIETFVPPMP